MSASPLDSLDCRILRELQSDGRQTNQALCQRVGLSPSACLARVRRLERRGVIAGYAARLVAPRVGIGVVLFAEVTLARHNLNDFARFEAKVLATPAVVEMAQVSGPYDYMLKIAVPDVAGWIELSDELMAGDLGITKITTLVVLKDTKPFAGYPL